MIEVEIDGRRSTPPHLSKGQDILLCQGDSISVRTPGGGGFGDPSTRDRELILRDLRRGYYDHQLLKTLFGIDPGRLTE
jgi:N-methylhydantoinase B